MKKLLNRTSNIFFNSIRTILPTFTSLLLSFIIVKFYSKELWGEFVNYLLFFFIASIITSWGSKELLLRSFSRNPKDIIQNWQNFFLIRIPICLFFVISILLFYEPTGFIFLTLWLVGIFITNSILPIIIYNRDFSKSIYIEIISLLALLSLLSIYQKTLDIYILIKIYAIYQGIKSLLLIILYRVFMVFQHYNFNFSLLKTGIPFLLLGITGFLQSKIDLYTFSYFNSGKLLGEYQVITGFFVFSQSIPTLLVIPFLKNIYRLQSSNLKKIKTTIILVGLFLNLLVTTIIWILLTNLYNIHLNTYQLILGFSIGFPAYFYVLHVFNLLKKSKETHVVIICLLGMFTNLITSIILLYLGYNITGGLIANVIAQILSLFAYSQYKIDDPILKKS